MGHECSNEECDQAVVRMSELEHETCSIPSESMADMAAKIIAVTAYFDFGIEGYASGELRNEIRQLASFPVPGDAG